MDALGDKLVRRWIDFGRLLRRNGVQTIKAANTGLDKTRPWANIHDIVVDRPRHQHAERQVGKAKKQPFVAVGGADNIAGTQLDALQIIGCKLARFPNV